MEDWGELRPPSLDSPDLCAGVSPDASSSVLRCAARDGVLYSRRPTAGSESREGSSRTLGTRDIR
jgi:hypothetical protein